MFKIVVFFKLQPGIRIVYLVMSKVLNDSVSERVIRPTQTDIFLTSNYPYFPTKVCEKTEICPNMIQ